MNRRQFSAGAAAAGALALRSFAQTGTSTTHHGETFMQTLLIGTSGRGSKGIYRARFDGQTGIITTPQLVAESPSPSFIARSIALHPALYAVAGGDGGNAQAIAYRIDGAEAQKLSLVSTADAGGAGGCHISVHPDGRSVFIANYTAGSVASFHVAADGTLTRASVIAFPSDGHGPVADRQSKSFAHSALPSPDGGYVLVNDLGLDCIHIFGLDRASAKLSPHGKWQAHPGSGPRHLAPHPNGRWIYSINELSSTVDLLYWDAGKGVLTAHSSIATLPAGTNDREARACELVFSPDLRFLYASNRHQESFAVFSIDPGSGELNLIQIEANRSRESRHMTIDATGRWLISANMFSDNIAVIARDATTGRLSEQVSSVALGAPSCLLFA